MRREILVVPMADRGGAQPRLPQASEERQAHVSAGLSGRVDDMRRAWAGPSDPTPGDGPADAGACAEVLTRVLLSRTFNHQARGRLAGALPSLRERLLESITGHRPVPLFLLYNGGYRASPFPGVLEPTFVPDQTELLLLWQVTLLHQAMTAAYAPGMEFVVVLNNGVARQVNDIPIAATEAYAARFRSMIHAIGAAARVGVLVQSELGPTGDAPCPGAADLPQVPQTEKDHRIIERFLGRPCSADEARYRGGLYRWAEDGWARQLAPIVDARRAVVMRQVAHAGLLSFRPFPGGAIRSQNGCVGFLEVEGRWIPRLLTSETFGGHHVEVARPLGDFVPSMAGACHAEAALQGS